MKFGGTEHRDVYYERNAVQHADFGKKYGVAPGMVGLRGTYSLEVTVTRDDTPPGGIGTFFIIRDMKTLLMPAAGEFYILNKLD